MALEFLNDMALFVEVVKARSFRRAAEALGMPNSTLSRRISGLEKEIGLSRTTRKIELTEAGQLYFDRCKRIVDEARLAHEQLGEMLARPSGVLRASLPVDFANIYLAPLIAEFARLYPGISFEFDLNPRQVDLVSEPVDVVIRMGESASSNLIARKLASLRRCLYASPRPKHSCVTATRCASIKACRWLSVRTGNSRSLRPLVQVACLWAVCPASRCQKARATLVGAGAPE